VCDVRVQGCVCVMLGYGGVCDVRVWGCVCVVLWYSFKNAAHC